MDPTQAAQAVQQPTIFMEKFLTQYGPFIQAIGFLGWFLVGLAAIVAVCVMGIMVAPAVRHASNEYCRWVVAQIGPAPEPVKEEAEESKSDKVDVDKFVD